MHLDVELNDDIVAKMELRRIYSDLIMCYKIVFGMVKLEIGDFFTSLSTLTFLLVVIHTSYMHTITV